MDVNGDGKLSREELLEAYSKEFSIEEADEKVENIMKLVDIDNSGFIDYSEFITASVR